jgi:hypothetical protein
MSERTIVQNLALFHAHRLRLVRREIRRLERRMWWRHLKSKFKRKPRINTDLHGSKDHGGLVQLITYKCSCHGYVYAHPSNCLHTGMENLERE